MDYLALQNAVAGDLNRFDLLTPIPPNPAAVIPTKIQDRISYYAKSLFHPSDQLDYSITCVRGQSVYLLPQGMQSLFHVRLQMGGIWLPLQRTRYEYILDTDVLSPAFLSLPWCFAQYGDTLRLFATPDNPYPLELMGNMSPPPPVAPTDQNFWTDDGPKGAATLIILSTCADICRRTTHDTARADQYEALATSREAVALQELEGRLDGPVVMQGYL